MILMICTILLLVLYYFSTAPKRLLSLLGDCVPFSTARIMTVNNSLKYVSKKNLSTEFLSYSRPNDGIFIIQGLFTRKITVAVGEVWIQTKSESEINEFIIGLTEKIEQSNQIRKNTILANINLILYSWIPESVKKIFYKNRQKDYQLSSLQVLNTLLMLPAINFFKPKPKKQEQCGDKNYSFLSQGRLGALDSVSLPFL